MSLFRLVLSTVPLALMMLAAPVAYACDCGEDAAEAPKAQATSGCDCAGACACDAVKTDGAACACSKAEEGKGACACDNSACACDNGDCGCATGACGCGH